MTRGLRADIRGRVIAHAAEQQRADVLRRRIAWFDGQLDLDPERLIFIDETAASTKMARRRGRAPRGERCRAAVPHGHWKTTTFTAGLGDGEFAGDVLLGAALRSGDISLPGPDRMDNLLKVHS